MPFCLHTKYTCSFSTPPSPLPPPPPLCAPVALLALNSARWTCYFKTKGFIPSSIKNFLNCTPGCVGAARKSDPKPQSWIWATRTRNVPSPELTLNLTHLCSNRKITYRFECDDLPNLSQHRSPGACGCTQCEVEVLATVSSQRDSSFLHKHIKWNLNARHVPKTTGNGLDLYCNNLMDHVKLFEVHPLTQCFTTLYFICYTPVLHNLYSRQGKFRVQCPAQGLKEPTTLWLMDDPLYTWWTPIHVL